MKISFPKDCGNAPRKQIVLDFTKALLTGEMGELSEDAHAEIQFYHLKNEEIFTGFEALASVYPNDFKEKMAGLLVEQVITHGKFAAIYGVISLTDDSAINFCDVYIFSSAAKTGKIKEIKSYQI